MSHEIKSCPFCGLEGEALDWSEGESVLIHHPNTDCVLADLKCEDLEQWNQRAGDKERDQLKLDRATLAEELAELKGKKPDEAKRCQCVYDNPKSMRREHYQDGNLMWSISAVALTGALFEPESYWDRLEWRSGLFHLGDHTDLPKD